jgi:hypothetical protein
MHGVAMRAIVHDVDPGGSDDLASPLAKAHITAVSRGALRTAPATHCIEPACGPQQHMLGRSV